MPHVHNKDHAVERFPGLEVGAEQVFPMLTDCSRYFSIAVARKIHEKTTASQLKKIYVLGTSGRFAGESKTATSGERIDSTGLTRIGTPGKGNLHPIRRRQVLQLIDSSIKGCVLKNGHVFPGQVRRGKINSRLHIRYSRLEFTAVFQNSHEQLISGLPAPDYSSPWCLH